MVRSHIGNVVCRKALCVRVASSPPLQSKSEILFLVNGIMLLDFFYLKSKLAMFPGKNQRSILLELK